MRKITTFVSALGLVLGACRSDELRPAAQDASKMQNGYAVVNGLKMYYERHGSGKPLVLLHGGGSTISTTFGRLIPLLSTRRELIAVELQAHGRTGDRNAPESFEQDADDVAALLKALGIQKADVLGFSNGGSTSLQLAMRHPERVDHVVAVSALCKRDGMQAGFFEFMEKSTFKDMPKIYKDAFLAVTPDEAKLENMYNKDRQRMLNFVDWPDLHLKEIQAPVLLLQGDQDVVRAEHAIAMSHVIPNARVAIVPGNHGSFIGEAMSPESPMIGASVTIINAFLDSGTAHKPN